MRKVNYALVAGILLALLAAAMVVVVIGQANKTVTVYVANRDLAPRKLILPSYVSVAHVHPGDVPPGTVGDYSAIVDHYTLAPVFEGQTFVQGALASSANEAAVITSGLGPDERAFAVQANVAQALAGRIQPGDLVDVVAVVGGQGAPQAAAGSSASSQAAPAGEFAQTIIQRADVLDINLPASAIESQVQNQTTGQASSSGGVNPAQAATPVTVPGIYTLALTPEQVQEVALAENVGTLYLSLDPLGAVTPYSGGPTGLGALTTTSQAPPVGRQADSGGPGGAAGSGGAK